MISTSALYNRFLECSGTSTDTRTIRSGSLFFALKGPNFDANAYAQEALKKGARHAVVDDPSVATDDRFLLVANVLKALQDLGTHHRRRFNIPVIAITGSNGKTTTKELAQAVLGSDRPTLATIGNLNNHIGVPLTLLGMNEEHRIAIVEMGANKPGDIEELMAIAEPTHGLITNVGKAHLEGFGSFEGVVRTKTELYRWLKSSGGHLFVNADDQRLMTLSEEVERSTYGTSPEANTFGNAVPDGPFLRLMFRGLNDLDRSVNMKLIGGYNLTNALAAVALGQYFEVDDDRIAAALASYEPGNNRSQFSDTGKNGLVLDAYNANPTSVTAALENFAAMRTDRKKLAILGDMLELGTDSKAEHLAILDLVERLGLETRFVGAQFVEAAMGTGHLTYGSAGLLRLALEKEPVTGRLVLLKGSRGIKLETLVPEL